MKYIISVLAILQLVTARPQHNNAAKITLYENFNDGQGNFHFAFQINNGITQQQTGQLKLVNSTNNVTVMKGFFAVTAPNNSMHEVHYTADENGYQSRFSITASSLNSLNTRTRGSEKKAVHIARVAHINTEAQKQDKNGFQPQTVFMPTVLHLDNTTTNSTNQTAKEYPDRIGTPAIITLMGPG